RDLLQQHGQMPVKVSGLDANADLYAAGLKSFAVVQVMLALEAAFDIEFPERMLARRTFGSIAAIEASVNELVGAKG
ncbi:MAG: acyl carrier protein, partial [Proteobacteria bacterium]|nr:acyl carrier protein [Pseudomonadota bacterium]